MEKPIGVIDSGVGGLTVVKEMVHMLPNESIVYLGDDLRCPYGSRSPEEVIRFTFEMVGKLAEKNVKMLVIACNTATAVALELVREKFEFPIVGVIVPGARAAVNNSKTGKVAVLGTTGTIESGAYAEEIIRQKPDTIVHSLACPSFVPLVENGEYRSDYAKEVVHQTLKQLTNHDFDVTILGCTHYPLLKKHIQSALPKKVQVISSAVETVRDVEKGLNHFQMSCKSTNPRTIEFYTTGNVMKFKEIIIDWLNLENPLIKQIKLP